VCRFFESPLSPLHQSNRANIRVDITCDVPVLMSLVAGQRNRAGGLRISIRVTESTGRVFCQCRLVQRSAKLLQSQASSLQEFLSHESWCSDTARTSNVSLFPFSIIILLGQLQAFTAPSADPARPFFRFATLSYGAVWAPAGGAEGARMGEVSQIFQWRYLPSLTTSTCFRFNLLL
jgi:hypothetical protein